MKVPRQFSREEEPSANGAGTASYLYGRKQTVTHGMQKINWKCIIDINVKPKTTKFPEESTGETSL